jgi:hypothetical protein
MNFSEGRCCTAMCTIVKCKRVGVLEKDVKHGEWITMIPPLFLWNFSILLLYYLYPPLCHSLKSKFEFIILDNRRWVFTFKGEMSLSFKNRELVISVITPYLCYSGSNPLISFEINSIIICVYIVEHFSPGEQKQLWQYIKLWEYVREVKQVDNHYFHLLQELLFI